MFSKKPAQIVSIGIATAIGVNEFARYSRMMDSISVKASNVKFSAQGTLMSISFSLEISNKSNKSVNIRSLNGKLYVGKLFIGNFRSIQSTKIKPNTVSTLPITATINAQEVLNNAVGKDFKKGLNSSKSCASRYTTMCHPNVAIFCAIL